MCFGNGIVDDFTLRTEYFLFNAHSILFSVNFQNIGDDLKKTSDYSKFFNSVSI